MEKVTTAVPALSATMVNARVVVGSWMTRLTSVPRVVCTVIVSLVSRVGVALRGDAVQGAGGAGEAGGTVSRAAGAGGVWNAIVPEDSSVGA
jgi:hypothetical protein